MNAATFRVEHVLAVVPVGDIDAAIAWYGELFGRRPDNTPMTSLAEWHVAQGGWVQVTVDADRAGNGLLNLAVSDLPAAIDELAMRGLHFGAISDVNKGVRLSSLGDPDGNVVTLIGHFRVRY
ncbi:catechol 2,3-dioxygenase-like lactoylglutathione lyase family enzyme [Prauserella sediminis]|uniref:Catechol 2,3-dioxygenase-like lactoylglutathione lyase family enzyme n=1 Tax=Prauserella sediminis TaxID=577680 RepID=A0A839XFE7_9PSEU|nr:VOC family protein [Prauserella sediminis]MBB3662682.1 catechol 2,3-dioxygenase-like lactoylglutathione lyase family enzyme [Prauserella sediminis]